MKQKKKISNWTRTNILASYFNNSKVVIQSADSVSKGKILPPKKVCVWVWD